MASLDACSGALLPPALSIGSTRHRGGNGHGGPSGLAWGLRSAGAAAGRPCILLAALNDNPGPGSWLDSACAALAAAAAGAVHSMQHAKPHRTAQCMPLASISGASIPLQPGRRPPARAGTRLPQQSSQRRERATTEETQEGDEEQGNGASEESSEALMPRGGRLNKRDVLLFCSACHHNTAFDDPEDLVECHCCHRIFHTTCYSRHVARTEGLSLPDPDEWDAGVPWFHSQACHQVAEGLQRAVAAGEQAVVASGRHGNGHSWRLPTWLGGGGALPTAASATTGAAAADDRPPPRHTWRLLACASPRASPSSRLAMNQVYDVLSRDFGYTLGDYAQFDVAALLRTDGRPVCAAILDVYGADVAELFVVATRQELRRQGHCRMLMDQMAACLASAGVKKLVVSIDDDDSEAAEVWARLGFVPLAETKMRQLSWSLPAFSSQATEGTKYLCQELRA